jgi:type III restriction enzyme
VKKGKVFSKGDNLYDYSGHLEEYHHGYTITEINGYTQKVSFINGVSLSVGEVTGTQDESIIHRIQIRETIRTHLEREKELYSKGIKVLSLFFIDEVAKYKQYIDGKEANGEYADEFEQLYKEEVASFQQDLDSSKYQDYLNWLSDKKVHAGYFAIDKNKHLVNPSFKKTKEGDEVSDDLDAFDLIMRNKEELLSLQNPVRFIFSHSALKEGWDNPNVFQICTLKKSSSDVRKRQEVGRGLRLCVNQQGERMDEEVLGVQKVQVVNMLTVIANESYDSFAKGLQEEIAEVSADRPQKVKPKLFSGKTLKGDDGTIIALDEDQALEVYEDLRDRHYIEKDGSLNVSYTSSVEQGTFQLSDPYQKYIVSIEKILDSVLNAKAMMPENAFSQNIEMKLNKERFNSKDFQTLWGKIKTRTIYQVSFNPKELITNSIHSLDEKLHVEPLVVSVTSAVQKNKTSKEELEEGNAFGKKTIKSESVQGAANDSVKYDLVGKLVDLTTMTRGDIVKILKGIKSFTFDQFKQNPEDFIRKASVLINDQKGSVIIEHVDYHKIDESFSDEIFTDYSLRGQYGKNAMDAQKGLYDYLVTDSDVEKRLAEDMDAHQEIKMYVKLPSGFFIDTPVGNYNPDWAIVCDEKQVRHVYFIAETKGNNSQLELRRIENTKISCARKHFKEICGDAVTYDVVSDYRQLQNILLGS